MKKFKLFATVLLTVLCISFISCSKDDNNEETSAIVGKWEEVIKDPKGSMSIIFNADGTCAVTEAFEGGRTDVDKGHYTFDNAKSEGTLTFDEDEVKVKPTTLKLVKDILILTSYDGNNSLIQEYRRVK